MFTRLSIWLLFIIFMFVFVHYQRIHIVCKFIFIYAAASCEYFSFIERLLWKLEENKVGFFICIIVFLLGQIRISFIRSLAFVCGFARVKDKHFLGIRSSL
ncbi:hypothetical protein O3G_MSEX005415 [Manduca sexta]|uniref:Uncharacterized protein n=1 Tax=Manduca sexta TaxID=7130 RepID=A0A922CJE2_MANSE|nr:hypothetical protein O3G_MSEX005415 [Manduca sexta]KAG6448251.1 hypothetical protein O3G_MSEX005415 [Manduca sexta]